MSESENINYNAFLDESTQNVEEKNKGLKLNNSRSKFSSEGQKKPSQQDFEKQVSEYKKNDLEIKNKIAELSVKYKGFVLDKTLSSQKLMTVKDFERSAIKELTEIALTLDGDETKPEGVGSVGLSTLLLQMLLIQRDTINDLYFKVEQLSKKQDKQ